jgi:class 3 adenylate cyclase/tetratricopeptide (TPR) repeat protein
LAITGSAAKRPDEAEPELRRVTLMFADIQGSTALIQDLDPEAAAALIDPALTTMIEAVERFDGVASHRGDGIMAIFGAPSVAEDHGVRACLAALAIRDALAGHATMRVRVGIHVGDVVFRPVRLGRIWTQDAVGIAVHIAARLEQTAEPGTICVSGAAWRFARGFVNAVPMDAISVRGVDVPIERMLLLDADHSASRWGVRASTGLAPFVNRSREHAVLRLALDEVSGGDGIGGVHMRLVHIQGAPGLGKSRLLHEFLAGDSARRCLTVNLTGDQNHRAVPFHPVSVWLRGWLDIRSTDSVAEARSKLGRGLESLGTGGDIDGELLERMLGLAGPGPQIASRNEMARLDFGAAIARLLIAIAAGRQTILVAEDIDCFDVATRELLDSALLRLTGHRVLTVTASRSRVRLAVVAPAATQTLNLEPLPDADAGLLLSRIDPALAENSALASLILRKAGGNPLFLEEVAPLVARRGKDFDGAAPALDRDEAFEIPDRVEALIADRLSRLPRQSRRLVQLCAVIGTVVPLRLIAQLADQPTDAIHARMQKLQSEQLLYETRKYPDPQFTFKHSLTRDVAYRTILVARRRALHARIVQLMDADPERERHLDDLCFHALQAQLGRPTLALLQQAAQRAVERGAYQVGSTYLSRARDIAGALPDEDGLAQQRLDILVSLHVLLQLNDSYVEMEHVLDEAEPLAARLGDTARQTRILASRVHVMNITGRLGEAIELGERTRNVARASGDISMLVSASFFTGQSYFNAGSLRLADRTLTENLDALEAMTEQIDVSPDNPQVLKTRYTRAVMRPLTHGTRAYARALLGDFAGAVLDAEATEHYARSSGRDYDKIFAKVCGAFTALQQRCGATSVALFRDGLALSDTHDIAQLRAPLMAGLGHALLLEQDADAASEMLNAAYRLSRDSSRVMFQISAAIGMALTGLHLGEPDLARRFADEAVELADRMGFKAFHVHAVRAQGTVLAATSGLEDMGLARLETALELAGQLEMAPEIAHAHMALAMAGAPGGDAHLRAAARRYQALRMDDWFKTLRRAIANGIRPYL